MAHMDYTKNPPILCNDWHVDDVYNQAPWATEAQAIKVLEAIADNFDAKIGINWDVIDFWVAKFELNLVGK